MFGGRIIKTFDGVKARRKIMSNTVKVHVVIDGPIRFVGLEIIESSLLSHSMTPITFPVGEARQLAQMIIDAADYQEDNDTSNSKQAEDNER